jgi:hypothetical protein
MNKKDDELGFQLLLSTLNTMTEKIQNIESNVYNVVTSYNKILKSCTDLATVVSEQRIRIEQLERIISAYKK